MGDEGARASSRAAAWLAGLQGSGSGPSPGWGRGEARGYAAAAAVPFSSGCLLFLSPPQQVGSFFMINLCLVVIATQFSETKQRESQLMREQRVRFLSNASTLASFSEPGSCYEELLKYLVYVLRKAARRLAQVSRAAGVRAGLLSSPVPRGGQEPQPGGSCSRSHRRPSVHHLVHHHHHHHHHYHLGNGTLRAPRASPEIQDRDANGARRLMLPPPSTPALSGGPPGGAESVHSFYHADCRLEPVRCQAPPPRSPSEASGRTAGSGKVYPTVHTSPPPEMLKEKALVEAAPTSGPPTLTSLNIPPGPYSSMHKLLETQSTGERSGWGMLGPLPRGPGGVPERVGGLASQGQASDSRSATGGLGTFEPSRRVFEP